MAVSPDSSQTHSWPHLLSILTEKARREGLLDAVKQARGLEAKIRAAQESPGVRHKIASWISHCSESRFQKSGGAASRLRDEGNLKFRRNDVRGSLRLYTESVICAPEFGPELSLAFGNRSAALYHEGRTRECLADVALALKYRFPKDAEYKLHQRRGLCLMKLSRYADAIAALEKAAESILQHSAKLPRHQTQAVLKDIQAMIVEIRSLRDSPGGKAREGEEESEGAVAAADGEEVTYGSHARLRGASCALDLRRDEKHGRHIVANRALKVGDVLFCEAPFASVLLPEHYSTHCHHCHRAFRVPIPCLRCTQPRYCSEDCRMSSWSAYHRFECGNLELLSSVGVAHLAERCVLMCGSERLAALRTTIEKDFAVHDGGVGDAYADVFNLVEHLGCMDPSDVFQYAVTAILLAMFLELRTEFFTSHDSEAAGMMEKLSIRSSRPPDGGNNKRVDEDFMVFVAAVMLKHIGSLICNASAIYEVGSSDSPDYNLDAMNGGGGGESGGGVYSQRQYRIATAIYPSASMMNHSCDPTVINSFFNNRIIVRAIQEVPAGEEVWNCYGPHNRRHRRRERQEQLLSQYNFHCRCRCCESKSADDYVARFMALKCRYCDGPILMPEDGDEEDGENFHALPCADCGKVQEYSEQVEKVFLSNELLANASDSMKSMDFPNSINSLLRCLQLRAAALYRSHEDVTEVLDRLAECYVMTGEFGESLRNLQLCLVSIEERYGAHSIELAHELVKYADVIEASRIQNGQEQSKKDLEQEERQALRKAANIFHAHYGERHLSFKSTQARLDLIEKSS